MLKALIIDDEKAARFTLQTIVEQYCPDIEIVGIASDVPQAVLLINKNEPDLVFLDIEMPGYSGFDLLDFFKKIDFEIIFVTAYSQYAIKAFEVSAMDYILKPVEIEQIVAAVEKVKEKRSKGSLSERIELVKQVYRENKIEKIALPMSDGLHFIRIDEIVLFEADRAYTDIFLVDGSKHTVSKAIRSFEEILQDRTNFFRPHRSYLINLAHIKKYLRGESMVLMDNKATVIVARDKKQAFEQQLKAHSLSL